MKILKNNEGNTNYKQVKSGTRRAQIPRKPLDPPISWIVTQLLIYITSYYKLLLYYKISWSPGIQPRIFISGVSRLHHCCTLPQDDQRNGRL